MRKSLFQDNHEYVWFAFLFYAAVHVTIHMYLAAARPSPPEPDDAYTYILKAEQIISGCGLQNCAAIEDIRSQLADSVKDPRSERFRYRMLVRTTLVYHPLYTAVMVALGELGLDWEQAFIVISVFGTVLIGGGICYFLAPLWGTRATALAVALLALSAFRGQGLLHIVPSTIAFGVALFLWGAAVRGYRGWSLSALAVAILLLHPIGKLYCLAVIPIMFLTERKFYPARSTVLTTVAIVGLVGLAILIPMLVERPQMRILSEPWPANMTWFTALYANIKTALLTIVTFDTRSKPFASIVAAGIFLLAFWGYRESSEDQKRRVLAVLIPIVGMCAISIGHVLLNYPGEAFKRVWIAMATILSGGAAYALVGERGLLTDSNASRVRARQPSSIVRAIGLTFVALVAVSGAWTLAATAEKMRERSFETYVAAQAKRASESCGTLLFLGETAALFYLSHGAHRCGVRYLPAADNSRRVFLAESLRTARRPLLLVAPQPGPRQLKVDTHAPTRIQLPQAFAGEVRLKFISERDTVIKVENTANARAIEISLAGNSEPQWVTLKVNPSDVRELKIMSKEHSSQVFLEGLYLSKSQTSRWPWGADVVLRFGRHWKYVFGVSALGGGLFQTLEPLDTRGSTMLAKVE